MVFGKIPVFAEFDLSKKFIGGLNSALTEHAGMIMSFLRPYSQKLLGSCLVRRAFFCVENERHAVYSENGIERA